ncbi:hypothetical protein BRADI_1g08170v3 [Brachypodium distachyon]|uniref:DUF1618 domain-containing protein n=1 Tax=Brachypodium distachyon TaxID=15368 RepID=A0A0Q3JM45_BRADI|nr:hypothetical protein BRADI_1g08170v3 [Brachypodium distachyon]
MAGKGDADRGIVLIPALIMPKRPEDGTRGGGGRAAKRPRRRRHLYLVTDDWEQGYSIRKLDLEEDHDADPDAYTDDKEQQPAGTLPLVVFRLEAPHEGAHHFAAAFGTKIMALHHTPRRYVPVFDVRTRCLTFGPRMRRNPSAPIYVPVGDNKLFGLDFRTFQMLHPPPPPVDPNLNIVVPKWPSWRRLPEPPFAHERVTSHTVHPDGQTILVSVSNRRTGGTFAFDTAASSPEWTRTGDWQLPFRGPAHCDSELDAWVGLARDPDALGHLCSCDVPCATDDDGGGQARPAWKLSKEKLFCEDPTEKHVGATLVHLGGGGCRSRFCLLQCFSVDGREEGAYKEFMPERERHLLRLTTFSLKYDKNGDLRTAARRRVRSFELANAETKYGDFLMNPMAFWM